jgi:protein-tyrosine kinase
MNKHSSIKSSGSLLERASELYDFGAALRTGGHNTPSISLAPSDVFPAAPVPEVLPSLQEAPVFITAPPFDASASAHQAKSQHFATINRDRLRNNNFLDPEGPVSGLSEEFRIVKRQLLLAARGGKGIVPVEHGERILVCSANPNEGKTYCSINLALSMASEKDNRVLLVDADFAKPSILKTLGIESRPGLMDALADRNCDAESLIIQTDVHGLSILPAGAQTNQDTEYLAAARTAEIIEQLTRNDPGLACRPSIDGR